MSTGDYRALQPIEGDGESQSSHSDEGPICRICREGGELTELGELIHPCRCTGSLHFVHRFCLESWRNTGSLEQHLDRLVKCDICGHQYQFTNEKAPKCDVLIAYSCLFAWGLFLLFVFVGGQWCIGRICELMGREYFGWNLWLDKDIHLDPDTDYATTLLPQPVEIRNPTVFRTFLAGLSATGNLVVLLGCFLGVFCVFALFACAAWDAIMIHCGKAERVTGGLYILREICYLLRTHWVKVLGFFMVYLFLITILEVLSTKGAYAYNDATGGGGTGTKEEKEVRAVQQGVLAMQTLLGDCYFVSWTVILPFRHGVLRVKAFLARGYTVKDLEGQQEEEPGSGTGGAAEGDSLIDPGPELPV